jgi:hypothetical protein
MRVLRRDRLGGLIREYTQVAQGDTVSGTHRLRSQRAKASSIAVARVLERC